MKICSNHRDYEVPLIYTYAWNGSEYWCPYCGCHEGMLGAGEDVNETPELLKRARIYEKATEEYRDALSTSICCELEWKGKRIKPQDLPDEEKQRLKNIKEKGWELNKKIEDLK